jgi:hypothetical protein
MFGEPVVKARKKAAGDQRLPSKKQRPRKMMRYMLGHKYLHIHLSPKMPGVATFQKLEHGDAGISVVITCGTALGCKKAILHAGGAVFVINEFIDPHSVLPIHEGCFALLCRVALICSEKAQPGSNETLDRRSCAGEG